MSHTDRQPLPKSAGTDRIVLKANNRLGAVFSALYSFWIARQATVDNRAPVCGGRRDAYSLIFFNHEPSTSIENDFTSSPDELLTAALEFGTEGGTDFTSALNRALELMTSHWSTERYEPFQGEFDANSCTSFDIDRRTPVVIFLSDGEDYVKDETVYKICQSAASKGFANFHSDVIFWTD